MNYFIFSSIGKKVLLSASGFFLILFLLLHLSLNLLLIVDDTGVLYNLGVHFMASNTLIQAMEFVLFFGFIFHIVLSIMLYFQNKKARPQQYAVPNTFASSFISRNMIILGLLIFIFLIIHLYNFYYKMKITGDIGDTIIEGQKMHDVYTLVSGLFKSSVSYCLLYIMGSIVLGLHLVHGFWSAFQSIGLSNKTWMKRLKVIGYLYAGVITIGFSLIPLYFLLFFN